MEGIDAIHWMARGNWGFSVVWGRYGARAWLSACVLITGPGHAQPSATPVQDSPSVELTAEELFAFADARRDAGDFTAAETAYRALADNPNPDFRAEARFRLGLMLADRLDRYRDAAVEFRRILDEQPNSARVRLELARVQAMLGNLDAARRELRAVRASPLPPEVDQLVRFYANALAAQKPIGGSIEFALAPDSNINRATRSDTLGTIIGDFVLDKDAKERSGLGVASRAQLYGRVGIDAGTRLLVRASAAASLYRDARFNDTAASIEAGPEFAIGADRLSFAAGPSWRWYGNRPYSVSYGATADWLHPMGKRSQLRLQAGVTRIDNRLNDLQDGENYSLSAGMDRAFSARFGGGIQLQGARTSAGDPGYSDASAGVSGYLFRELGQTTAVVSVAYRRLEADARLFLYPERRSENFVSASISATFRALRLGTLAPYFRVRAERNTSTVEIYAYQRLASEFGLTAAF